MPSFIKGEIDLIGFGKRREVLLLLLFKRPNLILDKEFSCVLLLALLIPRFVSSKSKSARSVARAKTGKFLSDFLLSLLSAS